MDTHIFLPKGTDAMAINCVYTYLNIIKIFMSFCFVCVFHQKNEMQKRVFFFSISRDQWDTLKLTKIDLKEWK